MTTEEKITKLMLMKLDNSKAVYPITNTVWNRKDIRYTASDQKVKIEAYQIIGDVAWVGYRWSRAPLYGLYIGQFDGERVIPSDGMQYRWEKLDEFT